MAILSSKTVITELQNNPFGAELIPLSLQCIKYEQILWSVRINTLGKENEFQTNVPGTILIIFL